MAADQPNIRPASEADVPAIIAIREEVAGEGRWIGRELPLPDDLADRLRASITDGEGIYLVAEVDGAVVGDGGLHTNGAGHAELFMALLPGHRGAGLGRALLARALAWARAQPDVHKVTLQVWPHNDRALALYRHAGFIVEGYRHRHWRRADGELWDVIEMGLLVES
ncbi:N-acetyltransferase family protein [Aquihabitans sp. McL0605]|uniref:GNAT family N-acetyltransferase n=1 Tax=Aquihabitans sp. McL0605 TaxID=3415671 RepID=UPI003CF5F88E